MIESSSLTTRLSFGDSGIRVGLAGAFVQRITASLLLGRLSEVFLRLGTAAPVALEAEAALALARRLASGHGVVHVAHSDGWHRCRSPSWLSATSGDGTGVCCRESGSRVDGWTERWPSCGFKVERTLGG